MDYIDVARQWYDRLVSEKLPVGRLRWDTRRMNGDGEWKDVPLVCMEDLVNGAPLSADEHGRLVSTGLGRLRWGDRVSGRQVWEQTVHGKGDTLARVEMVRGYVECGPENEGAICRSFVELYAFAKLVDNRQGDDHRVGTLECSALLGGDVARVSVRWDDTPKNHALMAIRRLVVGSGCDGRKEVACVVSPAEAVEAVTKVACSAHAMMTKKPILHGWDRDR